MAGRTAYLRRARHWIANRGWRGFAAEVWYRLKLKLRRQATPGRENGNTRPHPFDVSYGTETGGLVWGEALDGRSANGAAAGDAAYWATGYYGISPSAFTRALGRLALPWREFTFVDIGCGKGRAMLLASRLPFKEIVGVELSPALAAVAERNVQRFGAPWRQAATPVRVEQGDATTLALPQGPLVVFLYHPFAAPVMRRFLTHLQRSLAPKGREAVVLYANPELGEMVAGTPGVTPMWRECFELTAEEGAADRFGSFGEIFSAYRVAAAPVATAAG